MPFLLSAFVAVLLVNSDPPKKTDLDAIQGTWSEEIVEVGGRKQPKDFLFAAKVIFEGDKVLVKIGRREPELRGTLKLEPKRKPKRYNLTSPQGRMAPAIYQLDGDVMKVCVGDVGEPPPTSFKTTPENGWSLIVYKREKPSPK